MGVKKRPDELAADVFQAKFESGVLIDGVVAAVERGRADVEALLVGDFFGADQAGGIAGASGGNGGIKRVGEGVAESDAWRRGLHSIAGVGAPSNMRDCVATLGIDSTRSSRVKS